MAKRAMETAREMGCAIPIALHLDHGDSFNLAKSGIEPASLRL